jgi:hypothetical protein
MHMKDRTSIIAIGVLVAAILSAIFVFYLEGEMKRVYGACWKGDIWPYSLMRLGCAGGMGGILSSLWRTAVNKLWVKSGRP